MTTMRDVARVAGVSAKTVSRVINNEPSVLQGTRARVLHAIAELDYEPDQSARNYANGYDANPWAMEPLHYDDQRERMRMQQMAGKAN